METLSQVEFEILALLALLIRKLSFEKRPELNEDALNALSQYFVASIITRPFRPGLFTATDKEHQPLLIFLSKYWRVIFQQDLRSSFFNSPNQKSLWFTKSAPGFYKYFENDYTDVNDKDEESCNKFIGFESLLIIHNDEQLNKSFDSVETKCLRKRLWIDDLNIIKSHLTENDTNDTNTARNDSEQTLRFNNSNIKSTMNKIQTLNNKRNRKQKVSAAVTTLVNSETKTSYDVLNVEEKTNTDLESENNKEKFFLDNSQNDLINQHKDHNNIVKSSSTECEFFSVSNSEDSQ